LPAEPRPAPTALSPFQQTALVLLRTFIGWHFLYEGYFKFMLPAWAPDGKPLAAWTSAGFIKAVNGPLASVARAATSSPAMQLWIDRLVMFGLIAVGVSLMLGLLTRIGCIGGLLLLAMFYFMAIPTTGLPQAGAEGTYLLVNKTLIEGLAVLSLLAFDTGRIAGIDKLWADRGARSRAVNRRVIEEGSGA
jgi:thiosulfate dehydrogenase [quinone] large subunit